MKTPRWKIATALAAVYLIWGSTYFAIRVAVQTLPPFGFAGIRFLISGAILYAWALYRGAGRPSGRQWLAATVVGTFLLLGGNGMVVWAEQRVVSGLAAVLVSLTPVWMTLFERWDSRQKNARRGFRIWIGPILGFLGICVLIGPAQFLGSTRPDLPGCLALLAASLFWAIGSLYARRAPIPLSVSQGTGMEMLAGGIVLMGVSTFAGESGRFHLQSVSAASAGAMLYLIFFGSLLGFTAYRWLLEHTSMALASTYAYVNPVIALLLGWLWGGETLGPRSLTAAALVLAGVALIVAQNKNPSSS